MKFRHIDLVLIITAMAVLLSGCGTLGSAPSSRAISVAFTAGLTPPASMNTSTTANIAATVTDDPKNLGVNWTVTCASAPCGSFKPASTASTAPTQFTAPTSIPSGGNVTVTATSVTDNTKTASATVAITQGAAISVTISAPRANMSVNSTAPFTAVVANDPQNAGVNWSVSCGSAPCGLFITANPVASGSPATYQAPASMNTVTLTATSVTDNTKSASTAVNIVQPATPLADGTYVYHMNGTDFTAANGESDYYVAGAFTISGGLISGGEQDFIDYYAAPRDSINPNTSSLALTPDGNLEIVLDTGDPAVGVNGVETLSAAFVSSTRALIGEYDTFATSTGTLDWQNSQQPPSGGYAFFVAGIDNKANGMAFGGVLNVDGSGSISGAGSVFDLNDAFLQGLAQGQSFSASTVLGPGGSVAPDSFGRITFTLNPANVDIGQIVLIGYIVNSSSIQLVETADALGGTAGGMALGQGVDTGTFSSGNLSGVTYAVGVDGADTNGPVQLAGVFSFDSASNNVSGNATLNDIAKQLSGTISAGTYLVDTTGRVTLAGLSGATFNNATMQLYLDGNGNAFSLSMDTSDVTAGYAFQQNPNASFSGPYAVSAYGVAPMAKSGPKSPVTWSAIGQVVSDGDGNVTGFSDFNVLAEPLTANVQLSGTATGSGEILTGVVAGFGVTSSDTADSFTYYVIDFIRVFGIETDSTQLSLAYFELQPPQK